MARAEREHRLRLLAVLYEGLISPKSAPSLQLRSLGDLYAGQVSGPSWIALAWRFVACRSRMAGYSEAVHIHDLRSQLLVFDSRFPKYPHFPLIRCSGHTPTPQIKRWVKKGVKKMVRSSGFEPPRYCYRQPLKLVRLPVPPRPRKTNPKRRGFTLSNSRPHPYCLAGALGAGA